MNAAFAGEERAIRHPPDEGINGVTERGRGSAYLSDTPTSDDCAVKLDRGPSAALDGNCLVTRLRSVDWVDRRFRQKQTIRLQIYIRDSRLHGSKQPSPASRPRPKWPRRCAVSWDDGQPSADVSMMTASRTTTTQPRDPSTAWRSDSSPPPAYQMPAVCAAKIIATG